jgi:subtilisin family serine protease
MSLSSTTQKPTGRNVGVAVIDSGVEFLNGWLKEQVREVLRVVRDGPIQCVYQREPSQNKWPNLDPHPDGHGTGICSLLGETSPGIELYVYQLSAQGYTDDPTVDNACSPLLRAFEHIVQNGDAITIINISQELIHGEPTPSLESRFQTVLGRMIDAGKIVVMASGNQRSEFPSPQQTRFPGYLKPSYTVGAADQWQDGWTRSKYSLARSQNGTYVPDIYALGSAPLDIPHLAGQNGTSFACARASGFVALGVELLRGVQFRRLTNGEIHNLVNLLSNMGDPVTNPASPPEPDRKCINAGSFLASLGP